MAVLRLHLAPGTIALAAQAALAEAGADHTLAWVDFAAGAQRSSAHLALNPKGRVPVLETPDGVLTETIAILEWIAATHPEAGLMPADPWQAARAREVMAFLASTMHVNHAHKRRGHRWADDPAAHAVMAAKVPQNMAENAAWLDGRIGAWVADRFSVADLYVWAITSWLDGDGAPLAGFPRLAAHHARVSARPAIASMPTGPA
ncbi:MAG: glutathione S-transferase family protein [Pseudomonadota bacterium]